jgi:hypothetical protein
MMHKLVNQILAPGRGIARARRSLREQVRDGQGGGRAAIEDKARRIDVRTFSDKRGHTWDAPYRGSSTRRSYAPHRQAERQALTTSSASTVFSHDDGQSIRKGR